MENETRGLARRPRTSSIANSAEAEGAFSSRNSPSPNRIPIDPEVLENIDGLYQNATKGGRKEAQNFVQAMKQAGVDINSQSDGFTVLAISVKNGYQELVKVLLEEGADPDVQCGPHKVTALYNSMDEDWRDDDSPTRTKKLEIVNVLLKAGANPDILCGEAGNTALLAAAESRDLEMVKMLLAFKADPNVLIDEGQVSVFFAVVQQTDPNPEVLPPDMRKIDLAMIDAMLKAGASPDLICDDEKRLINALFIATEKNDPVVVKMLLAAGASPDAKSENEQTTALFVAVKNNYPAVVRELLRKNADASTVCTAEESTALYEAVRNNRLDLVVKLLKSGLDENDVDTRCLDDHTALYRAASNNNTAIATQLLNKNADPNAGSAASDATALSRASKHGNALLVKKLLDAGAAPETLHRSKLGKITPLGFAAAKNHANVIAEFKDTEVDRAGPFCIAARLGNNEAILELLEIDADPDMFFILDDDVGEVTPMYEAAMNNKPDAIELLLANGANPDLLCTHGKISPLFCAAQKGHLRAVEELLEGGADPHILCREDKIAAIFIASQYGHAAIVQKLLDHGADPHAKFTDQELTPLSIALEKNHPEVVKLLREKGVRA